MTAPDDSVLEDARGTFLRQAAERDETHARLEAISATATSRHREVRATVRRTGELTDLSFSPNVYDLTTPSELAAAVVRTVAVARARAVSHAVDMFEPIVPPGLSAHDALSGDLPPALLSEWESAAEEDAR